MTQCTYGNGLEDNRSYDLQGRLVNQQLADALANIIDQRTYSYDKNSNIKASYIYNDMGQRTRKTIYQSDGTTIDNITIYHYDRMGMLVTETTETGVLMKDYIWNGGVIAAQITAMDGENAGAVTSESIIYLYTDHLMTNRLATDDNQQVVWRWEGEAFGNTPAEELGDVSVNLRFPGQYFDQETGLHYNRYRYYDQMLGRYITSDPMGLVGSGFNTYVYVNQNPIRWIDILGLTATCPSSPPAANDSNWEPDRGSETFHCSYRIFRETRKPCPDDPRGECVYDDDDVLVDENHAEWQCRGTPDSYPWWDPRHTTSDPGGPFHNTDAMWRTIDRHLGIER